MGDIKKFFQDIQKRKENELSIFDEKETQNSEEFQLKKEGAFSLEKIEARFDFVLPESFAPGLIPRIKNFVKILRKIEHLQIIETKTKKCDCYRKLSK